MATEYGAYGDQPWRDAQPQYPGQPRHGDGPPRHAARPPESRPSELRPPESRPSESRPSELRPPESRPSESRPSESRPSESWPPELRPPESRPPESRPPESRPPRAGRRRRGPASTAIAGIALALGLIGLVFSLFGVATQLLPRRFTAVQQREIVNWEFGRKWRVLSAGAIFPTSVNYAPPTVLDGSAPLTLTAGRIGIARQAGCRAATDPAAAAVLVRNGCSAVLRATYLDGTKSYVVTVGVAVLPSTAQAATAVTELGRAADVGGIAPGVGAVAFKNTPAAWFTNQRRQLSGSVWAGTYVALYTVGYADSRPREPVSGDSYADHEMTGMGLGVARAVLAAVAPQVPTPHCPGTPGC